LRSARPADHHAAESGSGFFVFKGLDFGDATITRDAPRCPDAAEVEMPHSCRMAGLETWS